MRIWEIFLIGVGLAMDAFAVSIVKGLAMKRINVRQLLLLAFFFGGFQAGMPVIGWLLGSTFAEKITRIDHWIAFVLLALIGGNMIREAIEEKREEEAPNADGDPPLPLTEVVLLAVATSIDALAVGVTFSFLKVNVLSAAALIGVTTFIISAAGVLLGFKTGGKFRDKAQIAGGVILIALGIKILIEHLMGA